MTLTHFVRVRILIRQPKRNGLCSIPFFLHKKPAVWNLLSLVTCYIQSPANRMHSCAVPGGFEKMNPSYLTKAFYKTVSQRFPERSAVLHAAFLHGSMPCAAKTPILKRKAASSGRAVSVGYCNLCAAANGDITYNGLHSKLYWHRLLISFTAPLQPVTQQFFVFLCLPYGSRPF